MNEYQLSKMLSKSPEFNSIFEEIIKHIILPATKAGNNLFDREHGNNHIPTSGFSKSEFDQTFQSYKEKDPSALNIFLNEDKNLIPFGSIIAVADRIVSHLANLKEELPLSFADMDRKEIAKVIKDQISDSEPEQIVIEQLEWQVVQICKAILGVDIVSILFGFIELLLVDVMLLKAFDEKLPEIILFVVFEIIGLVLSVINTAYNYRSCMA
ncbi:hypothetical protein Misp06_02938 [Microbulbifer sp. NBRC 101763]|uniref:hypothetical protein n=1 Tax=Microbulbifer sp. NBRC 101763 TaxID=1113820 RepID=UPI0030A90C14